MRSIGTSGGREEGKEQSRGKMTSREMMSLGEASQEERRIEKKGGREERGGKNNFQRGRDKTGSTMVGRTRT
jgi:hypothetical protein